MSGDERESGCWGQRGWDSHTGWRVGLWVVSLTASRKAVLCLFWWYSCIHMTVRSGCMWAQCARLKLKSLTELHKMTPWSDMQHKVSFFCQVLFPFLTTDPKYIKSASVMRLSRKITNDDTEISYNAAWDISFFYGGGRFVLKASPCLPQRVQQVRQSRFCKHTFTDYLWYCTFLQ